MLGVFAVVGLGGAAAAIVRFHITRGPTGFPWSTLWVNCAGSFLLALLLSALEPTGLVRDFLVAGFCSTFTTFSSFAWQVVVLGRAGRLAAASGLVLLTAVLPVAAAWLGMLLGGWR